MAVPELARRSQAIEAAAALAQAVEVLLTRERERQAHAPGRGLDVHASVGGLVQERGTGGVGQRQSQRIRADVETERARAQPYHLAVDDVERCVGPLARDHEGGRPGLPVAREVDADDAGTTDGDENRPPGVGEAQGGAAALEWHGRSLLDLDRRPGPGGVTTS
jgi:hypothetical protein